MTKEDPIHKAKKPALAIDVILFTVENEILKVGLMKREEDPYFGKYALPGRFVRYKEPIENTAKKVLESKCKIKSDNVFLNQLYVFGQDLNRDTRIRTVTVVYYALVKVKNIMFHQKSGFEWYDVIDLPKLAFDHKDIIEFAVNKLRKKSLHDLLVFNLMPSEFTLTELQKTHEAILNEEVDKRNFRKKLKEMKVVKSLKKYKRDGPHRPAQLYCFIKE